MRASPYVSLALWLFAGVSVYANQSELRGRLIDGNDQSYLAYVVEITNLADRSIREHIDVMADGSFSIRALPDGDYNVEVQTLYGAEITSSLVSVGPSSTG